MSQMTDTEELSNELEIIRLLVKNRLYYEKYFQIVAPYIKGEVDKILYELVDRYYKDCPDHNYIAEDEFRFYLKTNYHHIRQYMHIELLVDVVYALQLSSDSIKNYVHKLLEKDTHRQIEQLMLDAAITKSYNKLEDVGSLISRFKDVTRVTDNESIFFDMDIDKFVEDTLAMRGYCWRLRCLNEGVGPLTTSTLTHVFKRPETGGTTFLASEITYFAKQLGDDECIVWMNNEEAGRKVSERILEATVNATKAQILSDVEKAKKLFHERGGSRIRLYDNAYITIPLIREILSTYPVKILVIDQGDKVSFEGSKNFEMHMRLKELYRQFRELAKEFDVAIVTVGQASAEAEGKKWLTMDYMDNSKVGKPGEMDLIIGIGKTNAEGEENIRYIHVAKNKLNGKHIKASVLIDTEKARYADMA